MRDEVFLQLEKPPVSQAALLPLGQDMPLELAGACFSYNGGTVQTRGAEPWVDGSQEQPMAPHREFRRDTRGKTPV